MDLAELSQMQKYILPNQLLSLIIGEVDVPDNDYNPGAESVLVKIESDEHVTDHSIQESKLFSLEFNQSHK